MKHFTPFEYVLISIANAYGYDKMLFEDRIQWCVNQGTNLYNLLPEADDKPLYLKGIQELKRLQSSETSNYMMALDATASGNQILAVLTGCMKTAAGCGLVYPDVRSDVYTELAAIMNTFLPDDKKIGLHADGYQRNDLKQPYMVFFYGSEAAPKRTFGEGSAELMAFYKAVKQMAPGGINLMQDILGAVSLEQTRYNWDLPDGFNARTVAEVAVDRKIELEELLTEGGNPSTFTHRTYEEGHKDYYVAPVANVVQSVDAYLVRELKRRATYSRTKMKEAYKELSNKGYVPDLYATEECVSIRDIEDLSKEPAYLCKLMAILEYTMDYPEFHVVTVHDAFTASPVHIDMVRFLYKELLAEIAESDLCERILSSLYREDITYTPEGDKHLLAKTIRENSNYSLC